MIWLYVVCFIAGLFAGLGIVMCGTMYAMKHPEHVMPYIMKTMMGKK